MKIDAFKNIKEEVYNWLLKYPSLRDSDLKLVANVWAFVIGKERLDEITGKDLLKMMAAGELPSFETIRRTRAKIQEQHPEVRGETYAERQTRAANISKEIHNL